MGQPSRLLGLTVLLVLVLAGCSPAPRATLTAGARLAADLEDPCEVLTIAQVSAATGLRVTDRRRLPSITELVAAQKEKGSPPPGQICSYQTDSEFGAIEVGLPTAAERGSARYWEARNSYFSTFRGSAEVVQGIGQDAWLGGGNSLRILLREDFHLTLATQMYQPRSGELLVRLASAIGKRE